MISLKAYLDPEISQGSRGYLSRRIAKSEVNEALRLEYGLPLMLYELSRRMFFEWKIRLPNPTLPPTEKPEIHDLGPEA